MNDRLSRCALVRVAGAAAAASALPPMLLSACSAPSPMASMASSGPPITDAGAMLELTSPQALAAIRSGRLSAEAYVTAALDRAERTKDLNAFIALDRAGSLEKARRVDQQRAGNAMLPPLAGLPIVVKDNINTADLPTTGGTAALREMRPKANAPVLQRLLDAGAIVIGKTNLHELAFGITSTNLTSFANPVKNPYDKTRIPGGSSGGTAAAIAARVAPAGLGSDTGGSTRIPAALCGIAGLRPSVGNGGNDRRYESAGVVPISHTRDTIGPMGRSVADLALLDAVVTRSAPPLAAALAGVRLGVPGSFWAGLDPAVATVMADARRKLVAAGVVFVDIDAPTIPALNEKVSFPVALHEPIADFPAYLAASGLPPTSIPQIAAQVASPDVKGAFGAIVADAAGGGYADAITKFRPQLQAAYADYFRANRVEAMFFPTTVAPAIPIDAAAGSGKFRLGGAEVDTFATFIRNTDPGSNAGIPGVALHAGMTAGGLPVGLEIDGPLGTDRRLLAIALAMEAVLGRAPAPPAS